ncbi:MAG: hypothetical protein V3S69_07965 [Dehalococcoidales bacterium]
MTNFSYGADIELFIQGSGGDIVLAEVACPLLTDVPNNHELGLNIDGACLEYHVPVCNGLVEFTHALRDSIHAISEAVKQQGYTVALLPAHSFLEQELVSSKYGQKFGCKPDYNTYSPGHCRRLKACDYGSLRTAGGHLHIGLPKDRELSLPSVVKILDALLVPFWNEESPRTALFPAGTFRPTPYGLEYRTLDNSWCDGYSSQLRRVIQALQKLEDGWANMQVLEAELCHCTSPSEAMLTLDDHYLL